MLFSKKSKEKLDPKLQKQQQIAKQTIQDLIPIKRIGDGVLITPDNRMIQILKVSALNLELTSNAELNELFETYEGFLMTLNFPVQIANVSMPVDLKSYIADQQRKQKATKNPYKRMLQESYIDYAKEIEINQDIMQRQRYIIFAEKLKDDTPDVRLQTMSVIEDKKDEIIASLSELELIATPVNDLEIIRYFHTLFDYQGAQNMPIEDAFVPQLIIGGKKDVE